MRIFIYLRDSTDDQEDNTNLERQEMDCRAHCEQKGFIVSDIFREEFSNTPGIVMSRGIPPISTVALTL